MKKPLLVVVALTGGASADSGLVAHAIRTEVDDRGAFLVTIDRGGEAGIEMTQSCQVIVGGKPSRAPCAVQSVEPRRAVIKTSIPTDAADHALSVRFAKLPALPPLPSITARALKLEVSGGNLLVTAGVGSEQGVDKTNTCVVLVGDKPLDHTQCTLIRVDRRTTVVRTTIDEDALDRKHPDLSVRFDPAK